MSYLVSQIDSNVWYSMKNQATGYYLGGGFDDQGNGAIWLEESGTADNSIWQMAGAEVGRFDDGTINVLYVLRSKAWGLDYNGQPYCMETYDCPIAKDGDIPTCSLVPLLQPCDDRAIRWSLGLVSDDQGQGNSWSFYPYSNSVQLYAIPGTGQLNLTNSFDVINAGGNLSYFNWQFSAVSSINDAAWSTFPPAVAAIAPYTTIPEFLATTTIPATVQTTSGTQNTISTGSTTPASTAMPTPTPSPTPSSTPSYSTLPSSPATPVPSSTAPVYGLTGASLGAPGATGMQTIPAASASATPTSSAGRTIRKWSTALIAMLVASSMAFSAV